MKEINNPAAKNKHWPKPLKKPSALPSCSPHSLSQLTLWEQQWGRRLPQPSRDADLSLLQTSKCSEMPFTSRIIRNLIPISPAQLIVCGQFDCKSAQRCRITILLLLDIAFAISTIDCMALFSHLPAPGG